MSTVKAASDFLSMLERSELLTPDQIARATVKLNISGNDSPVNVAKLLVKWGVITRFQATRLLEGKYRGFFIDRFLIDDILVLAEQDPFLLQMEDASKDVHLHTVDCHPKPVEMHRKSIIMHINADIMQ